MCHRQAWNASRSSRPTWGCVDTGYSARRDCAAAHARGVGGRRLAQSNLQVSMNGNDETRATGAHGEQQQGHVRTFASRPPPLIAPSRSVPYRTLTESPEALSQTHLPVVCARAPSGHTQPRTSRALHFSPAPTRTHAHTEPARHAWPCPAHSPRFCLSPGAHGQVRKQGGRGEAHLPRAAPSSSPPEAPHCMLRPPSRLCGPNARPHSTVAR